MIERTVAKLGAGAVTLAVGSFLVLGTTRLIVGVETARLLSAPLFAGGFLLAGVVFVLSMLVTVGVLGE